MITSPFNALNGLLALNALDQGKQLFLGAADDCTTGTTMTLVSHQTANRTIGLPDSSGTMALTSDIPVVTGTANAYAKFNGSGNLTSSLYLPTINVSAGVVATFPTTSQTLAGLTSTQTLTNKTIAVGSNSITGTASTLAQFNSSGNLVASNALPPITGTANSVAAFDNSGVLTGTTTLVVATVSDGGGTTVSNDNITTGFINGTSSHITNSGYGSIVGSTTQSGATLNVNGIGSFVGTNSSSSASITLSNVASSFVGISGSGAGSVVTSAALTTSLVVGTANTAVALNPQNSIVAFDTGFSQTATVNANHVLAVGDGITVTGEASMTMGPGHTNDTYGCAMLGSYALTPGGTIGSMVATDPGVVYGNGVLGAKSTSYILYKDGKLKEYGANIVPVRIVTGNATLSARTDRKIILNSSGTKTVTFPAGEDGLTYDFGFHSSDTTVWTLAGTGGNTINAQLSTIAAAKAVLSFSATHLSGVWYLV